MSEQKNEKPLQERLTAFGKETGKETLKLAVTSVKLYLVLTPLGSFLGGLGAYFYAHHADHGFWLSFGLVLLGLFLGTILGFFTAQIAIATLVEEMIWDKGTAAAQTGFAEAKKIFKKDEDEKQG